MLAAAVVALAWVTLGVLVGEHRILDGHHQRARVVLGGDQFDMILLTARFVVDCQGKFRVEIGEGNRSVIHGVRPGRADSGWGWTSYGDVHRLSRNRPNLAINQVR